MWEDDKGVWRQGRRPVSTDKVKQLPQRGARVVINGLSCLLDQVTYRYSGNDVELTIRCRVQSKLQQDSQLGQPPQSPDRPEPKQRKWSNGYSNWSEEEWEC